MDTSCQYLTINCDTVWSPSTVVLSKSLERIHSHFVNSLSHTDTFVRLTLAERRQFHTAVVVFKSINKLGPVYMYDLFTSSVTLTGFSGRNHAASCNFTYLELELHMVEVVSTIVGRFSGIS